MPPHQLCQLSLAPTLQKRATTLWFSWRIQFSLCKCQLRYGISHFLQSDLFSSRSESREIYLMLKQTREQKSTLICWSQRSCYLQGWNRMLVLITESSISSNFIAISFSTLVVAATCFFFLYGMAHKQTARSTNWHLGIETDEKIPFAVPPSLCTWCSSPPPEFQLN